MNKKSVNEIQSAHTLGKRLSVSLMLIDQEKSIITEQSLYLSNRRAHKYSQIQSVDRETSREESIRVYASCLRSDIEYRTVRISKTTARQVIMGLPS